MDWIKIFCNMLAHPKIQIIRKSPEGESLVLLWIFTLIEAGKCDCGGYLMIAEGVPYSDETLSMVTGLPLATVKLGLVLFERLKMIDTDDGVIYVKNWPKYQSVDKIEVRREKDRLRKQRQRDRDRQRLISDKTLVPSRDNECDLSRDVTPQNRTENIKTKITNLEELNSLLCGTPFSDVSSSTIYGLVDELGMDKVIVGADLAAETWRRQKNTIPNPTAYLISLCKSYEIPKWYVPLSERISALEKKEKNRRAQKEKEQNREAEEQSQVEELNGVWAQLEDKEKESLLAEVRNEYKASFPNGPESEQGFLIMAKTLAYKRKSELITIES